MSSSTISVHQPLIVFHTGDEQTKDELAIEMTSSSSSSSSSSASSSSSTSASSGNEMAHTSRIDNLSDDEEGRVGLLLGAASKNNVDRVMLMLENGISPNASDYDRRTALHLAASEGSLETARLLLDHGADVNARDRFGHTAMDDATARGFHDLIRLLREYGAVYGTIGQHEQTLISAAANGDIKQVEMLLNAGVNPNCADYDGRTPLHLAVAEQQVEMIKLLLSHKANPKAEDRFGLTPIAEVLRLATRTGTDPLRGIFNNFLDSKDQRRRLSAFSVFFLGFEFVMIILLGLFCRYDRLTVDGGSTLDLTNTTNVSNWYPVWQIYPLYQDVHVMIFIGFGFLMVFLRKNSYTSVGYTFLIGAFVIQWYQLTSAFWNCVFTGIFQNFSIDITKLVQGDFCAGSVLITFGVVLGKVSPFQMLFVALIETAVYALNERIGTQLGVSDVGGTMIIHMFGAFFGLSLSLVVSPSQAHGNPHNAAVYHSDTMSMVGTIFLWLFWPSFNGATAVSVVQHRAIVNTVLGLCGSCVTAFLMSHIMRGERKFNMVDVQNATLAGGVALGACCSMLISPGSAVAIGSVAGAVSVLGFTVIQPFLESTVGLHDTCGVNNLHGMPSMIGGFAAVIAASQASASSYGTQLNLVFPDLTDTRSANKQAAYQFAFMCVSVGMGLVGGALTGEIVKWSLFDPIIRSEDMFVDSPNWEVPHLEIPYYFDHRGEISRGKANLALDSTVNSNSPSNDMERLMERDLTQQKHRLLEARFASVEAQLAALHRKQQTRTRMSATMPSAAVAPVAPVNPMMMMMAPHYSYPNSATISNASNSASTSTSTPALIPAVAPAPASSFAAPTAAYPYPFPVSMYGFPAPPPPPPPPSSSLADRGSNQKLERMMELLLARLDPAASNLHANKSE